MNAKAQTEAETVTIRELHEKLGVQAISRGAIYEAIKRGEIPHVRLGGRILILRSWVSTVLGNKK
ncbi:helix-turn-helix domain-containing protein [Tunturiibacter gelidoferens]|uniref:Excisionase family DNA binding protein n=1 Tax=Tunturiibacter gelidiferens TaxID=3069689 RepID=A0A9X0U507_9BACT|nr:helix-turn-helix domain-containing protein [Edaphobacter lichenicola]MBB5329994.1 excisionase family DNA binding protein [Edaphobacter lichenicola]